MRKLGILMESSFAHDGAKNHPSELLQPTRARLPTHTTTRPAQDIHFFALFSHTLILQNGYRYRTYNCFAVRWVKGKAPSRKMRQTSPMHFMNSRLST